MQICSNIEFTPLFSTICTCCAKRDLGCNAVTEYVHEWYANMHYAAINIEFIHLFSPIYKCCAKHGLSRYAVTGNVHKCYANMQQY